MNQEANFEWAISHDPLVVPMFLNLERAHKVVHAKAKEVWDQHGLTPAEFDVLATLRCAEASHELTPGQLQERVLITSGGLTKVIHLLEEKGYVERSVAKQDNRVKPVRLTAKGNRFVGKVMRELVDMTRAWMRSALADTEIQQATQALFRVMESGHA